MLFRVRALQRSVSDREDENCCFLLSKAAHEIYGWTDRAPPVEFKGGGDLWKDELGHTIRIHVGLGVIACMGGALSLAVNAQMRVNSKKLPEFRLSFRKTTI